MQSKTLRALVDVSDGLTLTSLQDLTSGHEWIHPDRAIPLFGFTTWIAQSDGRSGTSADDLDVRTISTNERAIEVEARCRTSPVAFSVLLELPADSDDLRVTVSAHNTGDRPMLLRLICPLLTPYQPPADGGALMGMVPIELGTVRALRPRVRLSTGGHFSNRGFSPTASSFPAATVYDKRTGRGLTVHGGDGPAQTFVVTNREISCAQAVEIAPRQRTTCVPVWLRATSDEWRAATVPTATRRNPTVPSGDARWFREAGAIYNPLGEGGGGIYQDERTMSLAERIDSFAQLPELLDEARSLGTDVLHLFDFWEGAAGAPHPPYWNKGDYTPRSDLGGEEALIAGVDAVHRRGGRITLYLEPFIVYQHSRLGRTHGADWALRDPVSGELVMPYETNYTMPPWSRPWRDHLVAVTRRYTRRYHADGIFLDSWGWQWNWPGLTHDPRQSGTADDWNHAVLETIDLVRATARAANPDAIVFTESLTVPMTSHADGGLDATFAWNRDTNGERLPASPIRYLVPGLNIFSSGHDRNELHQVFAAGAALALSSRWLDDSDHVRRLVLARQEHTDTLVYGRHDSQPRTGHDDVFAYGYTADNGSRAVTVVNTGPADYTGELHIGPDPEGWREVFTGDTLTPAPGRASGHLMVSVPAHDVRLLIRGRPLHG